MSKNQGAISLRDDHTTFVPKDLFFEGMVLPVDIFMRMSKGMYLLIGREGEKANFSELHSFNHPNFAIYVRTFEHEKLIHAITDMTGKIVSRPNVPGKVKVQFINALMKDATSSLEENKFTTAAHLKRVAQLILDMREASPLFEEVMNILHEDPLDSSKHTMITCMLSLALAEEMGLTNQNAVFEKLAMGALLHDVGLKFVPPEIMAKPRHQWTPAELAIYENHPIHGVQMLRDLKDLPSDVLLIVAEHHENAQGTGYPKRIRDVRISPLARIVGLADYVAECLTANNNGVHNADDVVKSIEDVLGQPFNRQVFSALKNIVNKRNLDDKIKKAA